MGTLAIPLKHLKAEKNMAVTQPYSLQAAGPDKAVLYLHLELRVCGCLDYVVSVVCCAFG